jgi:type VI secretion system secreted protein VgrG
VPSITRSPTITLSPTITDTPLVTDTATITLTPSLPLAVLALFQSSITPNPNTVLSSLTFSTQIDNEQPVDPQTVFENPIGQIFATYSYTDMVPGSQWTSIWLRDGKQVCLETHPFAGGTGGYDDASCSNPIGGWQPGIYETQIFVGEDVKVVGKFLVQGNPPTAIPSFTPTITRTPSLTPVPTLTLTPSLTPSLTPPAIGTP